MDTTELTQALEEMDAVELAAGAGFAGAILGSMVVFAIVWFFISAIGFYKMNQKAGEAGWKAFIPFYAKYIRFKYSWATKPFLFYLIGFILMQFSEAESIIIILLALAGAIVTLVCEIKLDLRTAKAFGKSTGWGILLFFLPFVGSLILGFGKAEYLGPVSGKEKKEEA